MGRTIVLNSDILNNPAVAGVLKIAAINVTIYKPINKIIPTRASLCFDFFKIFHPLFY